MGIGRKRTHKRARTAQTIPELRRAFEHIEDIGNRLIKLPMKDAVKEFQHEWRATFYKELDYNSAEAYLEHLKEHGRRVHHDRTRKMRGGQAVPLAGAPLDTHVRAGVYISPGVNEGSYALVPRYIDSGFWNPEPAYQKDPVPGQTMYPTQVPFGMGSNLVVKGGKRKTRRAVRGGSTLSQALLRAIPSTVPPSVPQDAITAWHGQPLGKSPDPTQN